jgi:methionine-S-sulfoxide reductase
VQTSVGYTQGTTKDPTYEDVCSGTTGHVEAVQVEYDPAHVSYKQLLDAFWQKHDPTQQNRQVRKSSTSSSLLLEVLKTLHIPNPNRVIR